MGIILLIYVAGVTSSYYEAYRQWVCASLVPHWTRGRHRVKPCRSVCQRVEQKCPFFLPSDRAPSYPTQYAGEPTFLCLDPNIPETGEQLTRSTHATTCCFTHCKGHSLCIRPSASCAPDDTTPSSYGDHHYHYCTSGHTVTPSTCSHSTSSSANCVKKPLNLLIFAIVITVAHLLLTLKIDRLLLCRKRTTVRFK